MNTTQPTSRRRHAGRFGLLVAAAALASTALGVSGAQASSPAAGIRLQGRYVDLPGTVEVGAVSCARSGYCLVGGQAAGSHGDYGFVATIDNGVVGRYVPVPGMVYVSLLSCPQNEWCLAYGFGAATDSGKVTPDEVSSIANGVASPSIELGTNLPIRAVGCESSTNCFVAGAINSDGLIEPVLKGVPQSKDAKRFGGPLFTGISCPASLATCVVVGTNSALDKTRVGYVVRITGTSISTASAIGGIQSVESVTCTAYYSCLVSGVNTTTKTGQVENLSHTTVSHVENAGTSVVLATGCASASQCAVTAFTTSGHWGYVPVINGLPGKFVDVMTTVTSEQLYAIACQGAAHCYQVGYTTNGGSHIGVVERFALPNSSTTTTVPSPTALAERPGYVTPAGVTSINAASCAPSGYCMIGGTAVGSQGSYGFVAHIDNGTVGKLARVTGLASVQALDCPQNQFCMAYGFGSTVGGVTPDRTSAVSFGLPAAAQNVGSNMQIRTVGCESSTNCFLVGSVSGTGVIIPVIKGAPQLKDEKKYSGIVWSAIACPASLVTCVVVGSNRVKPRISYVVRISDTSISPASKTTGIQVLTGVWCSAYYTCLAAGFDSVTKNGATETLSHTTGSNQKSAAAQFLFDTTCATSTECVAVAETHSGNWGYEPITSGDPGAFVPIMPVTTKQSLSAVACQDTAHCYEVGYTTVSGKSVGVLERFSL